MSSTSIHRRIMALEKQMQVASEAMDFETAARVRNEIALLRGNDPGAPADDGGPVTVTVSQPPPGAMGLGTHVPVVEPPKNWRRPKKPDPMTRNVKPRGGR
jgi:UvrB/uvrC motif